MSAQTMIKRIFYMIIHYVILSIMAALSLVALYAAAIPIPKRMRAEKRQAEKKDEGTDQK